MSGFAAPTGRRQLAVWTGQKNWRALALAAAAGLMLAVWFTFIIKYSNGSNLRVRGFPIPAAIFHLDGKEWTRTAARPPARLRRGDHFLTGLAAPFIPFKIAEFLKLVKAELK